MMPLADNVEEMFIGPFGSSLKNDCFVDKDNGFCMVYEQKHAIQKTVNVKTRYVDEKKYNELKRFNIRGGDIIVSCRGTIGETFIVPDNAPLGIMHPSIMKIRIKEEVYDKFYFNLLLRERLKKHEAEANGSGIKMAISARELGAEFFPVPPMNEQRRISSLVLEVTKVIEALQQQLKKLDELVKARFVEMFGSLDKNTFAWNMTTVGALISSCDAGWSGNGTQREKGDGEIAVLKVSAVTKGYFIPSECKVLENQNSIKKYVFPQAGDLLFCRANTREMVGATAVITQDYPEHILPDKLWKIRFVDTVNVWYMKYILSSEVIRSVFSSISTGTSGSMFNVSMEKFKSIVIPLPPLELQNQFADFVKQSNKAKAAVQKALDEAQLLFDSLMQKYFG